MTCLECVFITPLGACRIEDGALERLQKKPSSDAADQVKKQYFEVMYKLFLLLNKDDDNQFYGEHCVFGLPKENLDRKAG